MNKEISKIEKILNDAPDKFNSKLPAIERKILNEILLLLKELDVKDGRIVSNIANLKRVNTIKRKLEKVVVNKEYLKDLKEYIHSFVHSANAIELYFKSADETWKTNTYFTAIRDTAVDNALQSLTRAGIDVNVSEPIRRMLMTAVTSGQNYDALIESLQKEIVSGNDNVGSLSRYAGTYTETALSLFNGQFLTAINNDFGWKWWRYSGSNIETTREFCLYMTKKKWVHESEFDTVLSGDIDGHQCEMYERTGLPRGLIEGTDAANFTVNAGGWRCRHKLIPVPDAAVPEDVRKKLEEKQKPYEYDAQEDARKNVVPKDEFAEKIRSEEADVMRMYQEKQGGKDIYVYDSDEDLQKKIQDADKFAKENNLSDIDRHTINMYSASEYAELNKGLWTDNMTPELQSFNNTLNRSLDKLQPYKGNVYRGVELEPEHIQRYIDAYNSKSILTEKGFTSTSNDPQKAFSGNVTFKITSKAGKEITPLSKFGETENEVLLKSGTQVRVTRFEQLTHGRYNIDLEEI